MCLSGWRRPYGGPGNERRRSYKYSRLTLGLFCTTYKNRSDVGVSELTCYCHQAVCCMYVSYCMRSATWLVRGCLPADQHEILETADTGPRVKREYFEDLLLTFRCSIWPTPAAPAHVPVVLLVHCSVAHSSIFLMTILYLEHYAAGAHKYYSQKMVQFSADVHTFHPQNGAVAYPASACGVIS